MLAVLRRTMLLLPALLWLAGCVTVASDAADLVVRDVALIDPGTATVRRVTLVIDGGTIRSVETPDTARGADGTREIDGRSLHAIPGLWDAHVHLAEQTDEPAALTALVRHGVLGARDAGSRLETLHDWQAQIESGARPGPAIVAAGPTLNGPGDDSLHIEVIDRASAAAAVASLAGRGVSWIKVHRLISPELLPFIVAEAHARGLRVFGHIPHGMSPLAACEAGMDGIEHVGSVLESIVSVQQGGADDLPAAVRELNGTGMSAFVNCLAERDVLFTPTLSVYRHLAGTDEGRRRMAERLIAALQPFVLRLHRAGVRLLVGTDAPLDGAVPWGAAVHEELRLLEQAGIPPADLLRLATVSSAERLAGRNTDIVAGAPADLLLLRADPRASTANLRSIAYVVAGGQLIAAEETPEIGHRPPPLGIR